MRPDKAHARTNKRVPDINADLWKLSVLLARRHASADQYTSLPGDAPGIIGLLQAQRSNAHTSLCQILNVKSLCRTQNALPTLTHALGIHLVKTVNGCLASYG